MRTRRHAFYATYSHTRTHAWMLKCRMQARQAEAEEVQQVITSAAEHVWIRGGCPKIGATRSYADVDRPMHSGVERRAAETLWVRGIAVTPLTRVAAGDDELLRAAEAVVQVLFKRCCLKGVVQKVLFKRCCSKGVV